MCKTLIGGLLTSFFVLAVTSIRAQDNSDVNGLGYARYHFNDFAVSGKFYHGVTLITVKDGIAELNSKEGQVSALWNDLPATFRNENAGKMTQYVFRPENYPEGDELEWSAINGKTYHDIEFKGYQNGIAQVHTREGIVLLSWEQLPSEFQRKYARVKTSHDENEARGRVEKVNAANAKVAGPLNVFTGNNTDKTRSHLVLIGTKADFTIAGRVFKMQAGKPYPVVGITSSETFLVATEYGTTVFPDTDLTYDLDAGNSFDAPTIFLKDAKAGGELNQPAPAESDQSNGLPHFHGDGKSTYSISYSCDLVSAQNLEQVYAVVQWIKNDQPVATDVQFVRTIPAGKPVSLFTSHDVPLAQKNDDLTYQIHIYSGRLELKKVDRLADLKVFSPAILVSKVVGASIEEVTRTFGYPISPIESTTTGLAIGYNFKVRSPVEGGELLMTANFTNGICYSVTYRKEQGAVKLPQLSSQDIAQWMLVYSKTLGGQWKLDGPKKWALEVGGTAPYKYYADWSTPESFTIQKVP